MTRGAAARGRALVGGVVTATAVATGVVTAPRAAAADPFCTTSWAGGTGSWSDASKWSGGMVPGAADFVCVLRASGAPQPAVTLGASTAVDGLTLVGATLRLPAATTTLSTNEDLVVTRSLVAGRGTTATSEFGAIRLDGARLSGVAVTGTGSLFLATTLTMTAGAQLRRSNYTGNVTFTGDVTVVDGDGDPANRIVLSSKGAEVAAGQTVTIGVPLELRSSGFSAAGTLRLPYLANLDPDGALSGLADTTVDLETWDGGTIELARTVTSLGRGGAVGGDARLLAPGGGDALADLTAVAGSLVLMRPLTLPRTLDVTGRLEARTVLTVDGLTVRGTGAAVARTAIVSPLVQVEPTAAVTANVISGRLESGGTTALQGARTGGLRLTSTARSSLSLQYPATVDRVATVAGTLKVYAPGQANLPPDGTQVVLLTAGRGVTGQFAGATLQPPVRGTITLTYTPTQVIGTFHAPA